MPLGDGTGPFGGDGPGAGGGRGRGRGRGRGKRMGLGRGPGILRGGRLRRISSNRNLQKQGTKAQVIAEKCTGCGACASVCSQNAITLEDVAIINPDKCTGCGACVDVCPREAIIMK